MNVTSNLRDNRDQYATITACSVCRHKTLHKFLSLGPTPLANSFLGEDQLSVPESYYPLDVCFCSTCGLVQLAQVVAPEIMFKDYPYLTSTSRPMEVHFAELAEDVMRRFDLPPESLVVDIGSNDGTLLRNFQKYNMKTMGIEPADNVAKLAVSRGIETSNEFFDEGLARRVCAEKGRAKVILATNVFAHVADLEGFVRGVTHLLADDGIFAIEVPYLVDMLGRVEFDTIYHEHLRYFAVRPLVTLFNRFGMGIVEIQRISVHGGSLRVYVQKTPYSSSSVAELLKFEAEERLDSLETYLEFTEKVRQVKEALLSLLKSLKAQGSRIAGYGATAKGNTLLNYCKIGTDTLDYISDTTPFKQGRYTPGMHIPVFQETHFHESPPDYALLLAWNYADDILQKEVGYRQAGGRFIAPLPKPQLI